MIYIDSRGDWKLGGFSYITLLRDSEVGVTEDEPYLSYCTPMLGFCAPEVTLEKKCSKASDVWSLGSLTNALFNNGMPIIRCSNVSAYKDQLRNFPKLMNIPNGLETILNDMLHIDARLRPTLQQIQECTYLKSGLISTIQFLEFFIQKTAIEKARFLKDLVKVLPGFSFKTCIHKILPILLNEFRDATMVSFLLPSLFW